MSHQEEEDEPRKLGQPCYIEFASLPRTEQNACILSTMSFSSHSFVLMGSYLNQNQFL
ncbi:unnamed protein product, partial [Musa hybrid cultivar]